MYAVTAQGAAELPPLVYVIAFVVFAVVVGVIACCGSRD